MALPVTITGIATDITPVGPFKSIGSNQIAASGGTGTSTNFGTTTVHAVAQSFTTVGAYSLGSIQFSFLRTGNTSDALNVEIRSGSQTGSLLGTSDNVEMRPYVASNLLLDLTVPKTLQFIFSTPIVLSAATQYFAVIKRTGAYSNTNIPIICGAASFYAGGAGSTSDGSDVWTTGSLDFPFATTDATYGYYFFGKDSSTATTLQAYKATDPTSSFSSIATKTGFTTAVLNIAGFQPVVPELSNVIHLMVCDGTLASSLNYKYQTFDMGSDTFVTAETIVSGLATAGQTGAGQPGCSIVVRTYTAEVTVLFNGAQVVSGSARARIYFSRRTAVNTWSAATLVDAGGAIDWVFPEVIVAAPAGSSGDDLRFLWQDNSAGTLQMRELSGTALQTASSSPSTTVAKSQQGASFVIVPPTLFANRSILNLTTLGAANGVVANYLEDNVTVISQTTIFTGEASSSGPVRAFADASLQDFWALYRKAADTDLYVRSSTDNGATWSSETLAFTATVGQTEPNLSRDGGLYVRDTDTVIPYIVNDNGTLKYNEYVIYSSVSSVYAAFCTPQTDGEIIVQMIEY